MRGGLVAGAGQAHRRAWHRHAVRTVELGGHGRRAARHHGPMAAPGHPRRASRRECEFPVYLQNDATSACGAELVFGQSGSLRDFVYFYIGAFAGGGIVLNGKLYGGPTGNAGALGSMPVPGPDGRPAQLIDVASIAMLEKALNARGARSVISVDVAGGLGRRRPRARRLDRPRRSRRSPMRSCRRPRLSISRRR